MKKLFLFILGFSWLVFSTVDAVRPEELMRAARQRSLNNRASIRLKTHGNRLDSGDEDDDDDAYDFNSYSYTPRKCCKIGQHLARRKMECSADRWYVARKNNRVHLAKLKLHTFAGRRWGKDIAMKAAKCHNQKAVLEKCCQWRQKYIRELEDCNAKRGSDRKMCRASIKARY